MAKRGLNTDWKKLESTLKFLWKKGYKAEQIAALFGISVARVKTRASYLGLPRRFHANGTPISLKPERGPRGPYKTTKYSFSQIEVGEAKVFDEARERVRNAARIWGRAHGAKFTINKVADNSVRVTRVA